MENSVVVVGGSLAGLIQGLQLKRNGINVVILEQDPSEIRPSQEAGVSIGPSVVELLGKLDDTRLPLAIPSDLLSPVWRRGLRLFDMHKPHNMSNWACLYMILRANFDGLASDLVPEPPFPRSGDGQAEYRRGKRVTSLSYSSEKNLVHVRHVNTMTGEQSTISASMVLAADGVHSTVRQLMGVPTREAYAGYIAWRGTVSEKLLTKETIEFFSNRLTFSLLGTSYFISYIIPSTLGEVEPGKRLINWVWYYPVRDGSTRMKEIFTDVNGKLHMSTVSQGLVNPDLWAAQLERHVPQMSKPLAQVVSSTASPFITKVVEAQCDKTSFFDGRLLLIGDAFTTFRSHLGLATEQAARHSLQIEKVLRGEMTVQQRNEEAAFYAQRLIFLNRFIGLTGLGWMFQLVQAVVGYMWLMLSHKIAHH